MAMPEHLPERTWPDVPSAQITAVGMEARAAPRLVVTAGPRKGAEFTLLEPLTTLGRAAGSGVAIADLSVSRRHCSLEKKGARWVLFDAGSGNGTGVNGKTVARQELRHGDEVALGDTRLRFLEPEGVIAWNDGSCGGRGRPGALAGALAAVALLAGVAAVRQQREQAREEAEARSLALREAARACVRESEALGKQGKGAEARDRLRAAAELDPSDPGIAMALRKAGEAAAEAAPAHPTGTPPAPAARPAGGGGQPIVEASLAGHVAWAPRQARAPGREVARSTALRHLELAAGLEGDDDLPEAAAHLRAALRSDPANAEARAGLQRVLARSREIYLRAYLSKDSDPAPARRMFALVAEALPEGDETGAKARRWLLRLEGKGRH